MVSRATGRMIRLLDDLLATARTRSAAFVDQEVELSGLVRGVAEEFTVLAGERSLRFDLRLASGPVVYADPASLDRAVSNLLSNAVRLAPVGSSITVATGSRRGWAFAAVRDDGPGIADEHRTDVFERFHRGPGPQAQGAGLGLAIARQIVESHGGRLILADRNGSGSTFVVWLPERAVAGAPAREAAPPTTDPT